MVQRSTVAGVVFEFLPPHFYTCDKVSATLNVDLVSDRTAARLAPKNQAAFV
jgi:hypothetical protein